MSMQPGPPAAGPPPVGTPPPQRLEVEAELFSALRQAAQNSRAANDPRMVKEFAAACLNFAQAIVILDPALVAPQGVPPEVIARSMPSPPEPQPIDAKAART